MSYYQMQLPVIAAALLASTTVHAVEGDKGLLRLETIVVTASPESEDKQKIEERTLRTHKVVDLAEILSDELVEVQMIRKSGYGNEVSMRGFGQENLKVMLDGGTLEGACGSRKDPSLSHINMLTVQDIQIQQGPFDVTRPGYLGGYVDVITRKPQQAFSGELLGKAGSFDYYSGGFSVTGGGDKVQGLLGFNYSESGQYQDGSGKRLWQVRQGMAAPYSLSGQQSKAFQKDDLWSKLQITPTANQTILLEHTYGKANDILTPRVAFDIEKEITQMSKASWEVRNLGSWSKKLSLSFYRNDVEHNPYQGLRTVAAPKNNIASRVITGGGVQNITDAGFATFTYGLDTLYEDWWADTYNSLNGVKVNDSLIPSVRSLNLGGYLQAEKQFERVTVGAGIRVDSLTQEAHENLQFTKTVTSTNRKTDTLVGGQLSLKYYPTDQITLFGGVGRSYRTPTGTERYLQGSSTFYGNPNLKPTANTELDVGVKFDHKQWKLQVKGFYSELTDFIYQQVSGGVQSYTNIDAYLWGGDIKGSVQLPVDFSLDAGAAWQQGRKKTRPANNYSDNLGQIAPLKTRMALNYNNAEPFGQKDTGLFGTFEWVHSNAATEIDNYAGEKSLGAWDVFNLRLGYRYRFVTLNVGVDNLFDKIYTSANSYEWDVVGGTGANPAIVNEPGRFVYGSLSFKW
ncbi:MAG: TonB-dependent receptor [Trichlorobacter sp.]|uniref:TonB-dependent receptor n=1 Tax=Trichlorobacter sp. TaxID=2911007 RepID=UPI0025628F8A|nr:TonB-dependent receptor [Trichlorobacter sp.]MDK9718634.1 TonB-dependent receptor [Trichlorobacter sp.]